MSRPYAHRSEIERLEPDFWSDIGSAARVGGIFTLADHAKATEGVECRKDKGVIDETPGAYKSIDAVMAAQADLVDVVATLKQLVCVKG